MSVFQSRWRKLFLVGLVVGPLVGLALAHYLLDVAALGRRLGAVVIALFLLFVLFAGFLDLELKVGIVLGGALGLLLAGTPYEVRSGTEEV